MLWASRIVATYQAALLSPPGRCGVRGDLGPIQGVAVLGT